MVSLAARCQYHLKSKDRGQQFIQIHIACPFSSKMGAQAKDTLIVSLSQLAMAEARCVFPFLNVLRAKSPALAEPGKVASEGTAGGVRFPVILRYLEAGKEWLRKPGGRGSGCLAASCLPGPSLKRSSLMQAQSENSQCPLDLGRARKGMAVGLSAGFLADGTDFTLKTIA